MNSKGISAAKAGASRAPAWVLIIGLSNLISLLLLVSMAAADAASAPEPQPPETPREFFNVGTQKLQEGKLREAEASFESALASQEERLQPPALYNLGHVRFKEGLEELKKGPSHSRSMASGRLAGQAAAEATQDAEGALASNELQRMVASYIHGRGTRKELRAAIKAVRRALESYNAVLNKWERSSGDFKSSAELDLQNADAQQNASTVDRCIAKLVDSIREMEKMMGQMGQQSKDLGEKLKELRGRIPAPEMPPGAAGDDDEDDEDFPNGPRPEQKEAPSKNGREMLLSPEQAGWLLEGFKLDRERRLPMGQNETGDPKDKNRKPW